MASNFPTAYIRVASQTYVLQHIFLFMFQFCLPDSHPRHNTKTFVISLVPSLHLCGAVHCVLCQDGGAGAGNPRFRTLLTVL